MSYFQNELRAISSYQSKLHKKLLIVGLLDALARGRHPSYGNRERFTKLISDYGEWPDGARLSLPQIVVLSSELSPTSKLTMEAERRLSTWTESSIPRLGLDPMPAELDPFIHSENERRLLNSCSHLQLAYLYRNHLVHEFREPGHPMEVSNDNQSPYYFGVASINNPNRASWELVYPDGFFINIAHSAIKNLAQYYIDAEINPYDQYSFGSPWRR